MSQKNKEVEKLPPQWSSSPNIRNPRIVRAPRDSGGKDRHSKVCTLRGLRDRRIRLSVPTAIQLYDLQDRLGLPQPSKVVDWLLDAAKDDVDRLPPLPAIPGLLPHHDPPANGAFGGFQNFFPTGNGQGFSLPYEGPSGSNGNGNSNYYMSNWDPAGLSLAGFGGGFGFGAQVAEEEKLPAFTTGSGSGSGSHHHHHHHHHQLY